MDGNAGVRVDIIQTIICMLDALNEDNKWISVTLFSSKNYIEKIKCRATNDLMRLYGMGCIDETLVRTGNT